MKVQKGSQLQDLKRDHHTSHLNKNKEPDALLIKLVFQHYHSRLRAYQPITHRAAVPPQLLENDLHPLSSWPIIWWKKEACNSPVIPIFIYLK